MEFFQVYRGTVKSDTKPGTLFKQIVHPALFPSTPFFSACVNHTHRIEHIWEWKIMITTATFTGARVAVIPVDDPSPDAIMDDRTAFQQVAAGRAAIATVTSTGDTNTYVMSFSSTTKLSNALPSLQNESWVGFANGSVFVYLLDQPIGLVTNAVLNVTVLARPRLSVFGSFAGFMLTENVFRPGESVSLTVTSPSSKDISTIFRYQGTALDTGYYFAYFKNGALTTDGTWRGVFKTGLIYRCDQVITGWTNKSAQTGKPLYFCPFENDSTSYLLVGFTDLGEAYTFTVSPQTVTTNTEYSVTQATAGVKYNTRFSGTVYIFTPISPGLVQEFLRMRATISTKPFVAPVERDVASSATHMSGAAFRPADDFIINIPEDDDFDDDDLLPSPSVEALRRQLEAGLDIRDAPRPLMSLPPLPPPELPPSLSFLY